MTKQEIKKAIEKGESVWFADNCNEKVWEIDLNEKYKPEIYLDQILYVYQNINDRFKQELFIENIYKTKAKAEHYLHHANITRTEQLPFYTFSEIAKDEKNFKMGKTYTLIEDKNFVLDINKSYVSQIVLYTGKEKYSWNFNEENFYKAYDECVRLFKQGE